MKNRIIRQRKVYYFAVEGEGEQALIKFLQWLLDQKGIYVHLDCVILGGGGYKSMLKNATHSFLRKGRQNNKNAFLIVDADRAAKDDGWTIEQLKQEASEQNITVCLQNPNQEGLFLRMLGIDHQQPDAKSVNQKLAKVWPDYQKPIDTYTLMSKFTLEDLLRVAKIDSDLELILTSIGLIIR